MELHKKSETRLFVQLSQADLSGYRLSFDELCAEGERTAAVIRDILERAEELLDWAIPARSRVCIDVLPGENGGCIFLFTVLHAPKKRFRVKVQSNMLLCVCSDAESFLQLFGYCRTQDFGAHASFFRLDTRYAALFCFADPTKAQGMRFSLSEFGKTSSADHFTQLFLEEHAEPITLRQAP